MGFLEVTPVDCRDWRRTFQNDWSRGHMTEAPCDVCYEKQEKKSWMASGSKHLVLLPPAFLSDVSINEAHHPAGLL